MEGKVFTVSEFPLVWECIECNNPFDEEDEDLIFVHPNYCHEYVCKYCYENLC